MLVDDANDLGYAPLLQHLLNLVPLVGDMNLPELLQLGDEFDHWVLEGEYGIPMVGLLRADTDLRDLLDR